LAELGLKPHLMTDDVVAAMLEQVLQYRDHIVADRILPRVRWR
jgi:UDP-sulfoquinovose synthase